MSNDDQQILDFVWAQYTFEGMAIDETNHEKYFYDPSNIILKSVISLENFYNLQDKFRQTTNCKTQSSTLNYTTVNMGMEQDPHFINIGVHCSHDEKKYLSNYWRN